VRLCDIGFAAAVKTTGMLNETARLRANLVPGTVRRILAEQKPAVELSALTPPSPATFPGAAAMLSQMSSASCTRSATLSCSIVCGETRTILSPLPRSGNHLRIGPGDASKPQPSASAGLSARLEHLDRISGRIVDDHPGAEGAAPFVRAGDTPAARNR
jgi:hypothetical protein